MENCIFCKIIAGDVPAHKVYEDDHVLAFLDLRPVNHGHTLVIPKEHCRNIFDIPEKALLEISAVVKKISVAIREGIEADGVTITMNNEQAGGQDVFHAHIHVIPRSKDDGLTTWPQQPYPNDTEMKDVLEKIRAALS